jgi:hypothetical protein
MNIFKNCKTTTDQGNIGLSKAIYEFQKMGYTISIPMTENQKYDLIIDYGEGLKRVQVKTTQFRSKHGTFTVNIKTCGGNRSGHKLHYFDKDSCDILFILTSEDDVYIIPTSVITAKSTLAMSKQLLEYKM